MALPARTVKRKALSGITVPLNKRHLVAWYAKALIMVTRGPEMIQFLKGWE
jgi:hypothetical protein